MSVNKSKGNMYPWCTHTWNPIKGRCPHQCIYCYMRGKPVGELRLDEKCLKDNLGSGKTIFVGSSTDMWAREVPLDWIEQVLAYCRQYSQNTYLFQSKNPARFYGLYSLFPNQTIFGTTLETNLQPIVDKISKAPELFMRWHSLNELKWQFRPMGTMVSIEPILNFTGGFVQFLETLHPLFVSIGADSKGHHLPEPPPEKVKELIAELRKLTEVKVKHNLKRILEER